MPTTQCWRYRAACDVETLRCSNIIGIEQLHININGCQVQHYDVSLAYNVGNSQMRFIAVYMKSSVPVDLSTDLCKWQAASVLSKKTFNATGSCRIMKMFIMTGSECHYPLRSYSFSKSQRTLLQQPTYIKGPVEQFAGHLASRQR